MQDVVNYVTVFITSLLPVAEVRGSIPLALILFNDFSKKVIAVILAVIGNLLVAPIALSILNYLDSIIRNSRYVPSTIRRTYVKLLERARREGVKVERKGLIGLTIFVAIPLPATGAWTASLIVFIMGFNKLKSLIAIELGVLIASAIVLVVVGFFQYVI
jgi:uncharacterized membrane protein